MFMYIWKLEFNKSRLDKWKTERKLIDSSVHTIIVTK